MPEKVYLGDSVYVTHDTFSVILSTNNGYGDTNVIYLEPSVIRNFEAWLKAAREVKDDS